MNTAPRGDFEFLTDDFEILLCTTKPRMIAVSFLDLCKSNLPFEADQNLQGAQLVPVLMTKAVRNSQENQIFNSSPHVL